MTEIRRVTRSDLAELKHVLDSIDLFPSEMLNDMISDYLDNPESEDIWITALENDKPISLAFCAPEKVTEGTYNLYAIGVQKDIQANQRNT